MSFLGIGLPAFTELAGGLLGGALNSAYQRSAMDKQVEAQKALWSYQQQNAHQFEVEDLRNAGLNPILSATNSQIASMPSVSTPTSAPYQGLVNGLGNAITSGLKLDLEKKRLDVELAKAKAETELIKNQTVESAWRSNVSAKQIETMDRELFEKVDLYSIRKALLENQRDSAGAMIGQIEAKTYELGSEAGLNYAQIALKEKEYKFGAFFSQYLPLAFLGDFEDDPSAALKKWKNEIFKVFEEKAGDMAPSVVEEFHDLKKFGVFSD